MYELVLLHPLHYLPKRGSALTVFTEDGNNLSGKMYLVSPDGALREGPDDNMPRLPAFSSNRARNSEDVLNPFLVVINAEIAFRRFKRQPHALCTEYTELIDLTIDLVDKIYFKPLVDEIEEKLNQTRLVYSKDTDGDVNMGGTADEFGTGKAVDNEKTITSRTSGKNSRTGTVVKRPGPNASHGEIVEYRQYLMSGCGRPFLFSTSMFCLWLMPDHIDIVNAEDEEGDEDDEDAEDENEEDDNGGMHFGLLNINSSLTLSSDVHPPKIMSPVGVFEKVKQWQVEAQ
jgi:hypothetical protein